MSKQITISIPGFIHARQAYAWEKNVHNGAAFVWFPVDAPIGDYSLVGNANLNFELPEDFDIRPVAIRELEKKKAELMSKFQMAVNEINDQITKLQSIEMA